jgi:hypothetical protein
VKSLARAGGETPISEKARRAPRPRVAGLDLPYTTFDKLRQVSQATVVENKHLAAVLSHIRERQLDRAEARSQSAPRRQGQVDHMFRVG